MTKIKREKQKKKKQVNQINKECTGLLVYQQPSKVDFCNFINVQLSLVPENCKVHPRHQFTRGEPSGP